jgi:hypothetical protein
MTVEGKAEEGRVLGRGSCRWIHVGGVGTVDGASALTSANPRPHHLGLGCVGAQWRRQAAHRSISTLMGGLARQSCFLQLPPSSRRAAELPPGTVRNSPPTHRSKQCVVAAWRHATVYRSMAARRMQRTRVTKHALGTLIQRTCRPLHTTVCAVLGACDMLRLWGMGEQDGSGRLDVPTAATLQHPSWEPHDCRLRGEMADGLWECGFPGNRSVQSDLRIQNRAISRLHAEVHLHQDKVSAPSHRCSRLM